MKKIKYSEYNYGMGELINIEDVLTYKEDLNVGKNIPYEKLIFNKEKYLDKSKPYFIICFKGVKSKKAVSILELYGYNVTQVLKN